MTNDDYLTEVTNLTNTLGEINRKAANTYSARKGCIEEALRAGVPAVAIAHAAKADPDIIRAFITGRVRRG